MPRQPRLDTPGALHHVMVRGIDRRAIFATPVDYDDFVRRLGLVSAGEGMQVLGWALMPNHVHLLVRSGSVPLAAVMRRLLTGYAVGFNWRNKRYGHLFQNRYKSILCEEEGYLLELVRYIHLNPLRASVVWSLEELDGWAYSGHSALMGTTSRPWQSTDEILSRFSALRSEAIRRYRDFVGDGVAQGQRPELVGGGLIRSAGGWAEVLALRRRKEGMAADQRVLGSGEFVESLWREAEAREAESLRVHHRRVSLSELALRLGEKTGVEETELRSGARRHAVVQARRAFSQLAVRRLGYAGAEVARYLGVTTSCVTREAAGTHWVPIAERLKDALR